MPPHPQAIVHHMATVFLLCTITTYEGSLNTTVTTSMKSIFTTILFFVSHSSGFEHSITKVFIYIYIYPPNPWYFFVYQPKTFIKSITTTFRYLSSNACPYIYTNSTHATQLNIKIRTFMNSTFTVIFPSKAYRCIILHGFKRPFHITLQINPLQLFKLPLYTTHWKYFMVDCDIHVSSINHFSLHWFQQHSVIQCLALLIYISTHPILQAPIYACLWSQFLVYCDILNKYLVL